MFIFGHLGIGSKLVHPFSRGLSDKAVLLGTILPDLIDKPLYYGFSFFTRKQGAELGMISGTRTLGHTALFLVLLTSSAYIKKSRFLAALSLGVASHLLLDSSADYFLNKFYNYPIQSGLFWPLNHAKFPIIHYNGIQEHLSTWLNPVILIGEIMGLGFLLTSFSTWNDFADQTKQLK